MVVRFIVFMVSVIFGVTMLVPVHDEGVSVYIEMLTPIEELEYGQPVELECIVDGIDDPDVVQWQYKDDESDWIDIDCHELVYSFILDEVNSQYYYRVVVIG